MNDTVVCIGNRKETTEDGPVEVGLGPAPLNLQVDVVTPLGSLADGGGDVQRGKVGLRLGGKEQIHWVM